ncbi:MAG: DUF3180 domain-containing protein [Lacisediminihabitans sp.]
MKRTRISTLAILGAVGAVGGALAESLLASNGAAIVVPQVGLPVALVAIAVIVVLLAVPIRRLTHGTSKAPVDPYYATRVVMLAKACALSGALLLGLSAGVVGYMLTRSALPSGGSIGLVVSTLVGSGLLLAAGLIAEHMCTIPPIGPDDDVDPKPIRVRP